MFLVVALRSNLFLNSPSDRPGLLALSLSPIERFWSGRDKRAFIASFKQLMAYSTMLRSGLEAGRGLSSLLVAGFLVLGEDVGGYALRNLEISELSCLLFGRYGAPNQLLGIQQSQWLHSFLVARIPVCGTSLLLMLGHSFWMSRCYSCIHLERRNDRR